MFIPKGFQFAGAYCGIKSDPSREDIALVVADQPCTSAGVYTTNIVHAASVARNRTLTPGNSCRLVVANSGNANTCTGQRGASDNDEMARLAAEKCGANSSQALVMSTGIIGEFLPMEKVSAGIGEAAGKLGKGEDDFMSAARGILTTDKSHKVSSKSIAVSSNEIRIAGMAKGAGMIGPKMATMLSTLTTDAALTPEDAQATLRHAVDKSFNCISVEGHMSTSDTVLLLASGAAGNGPLVGADLDSFRASLTEVCVELARMIPDDGEGASHLIQLDVRGCATEQDAFQIAKTISNSTLVKAGVAGCDPNWGRIVSAAGYSGVVFDPSKLSLTLNGFTVFENGEPKAFDEKTVSASMRDNRETEFILELGEGNATCRFWTSDLTVDYVRFNSEYHT